MRVKCVRVVDSRGRPATESSWLRLNGEYTVLSVAADTDGTVQLLLHHGRDDIGWWPATSFVTTDGTIPSNWKANDLISTRSG